MAGNSSYTRRPWLATARRSPKARRPSKAVCVRVGPFIAAGRPFVLEGNVAEVLDRLADRLRDLRAATAEATPTVFLIARRGPSWLSHPWGLWRDGEPCETTVTDSYLMPYVLWEVTRLVLESAHPLIPIHAAAVDRDGRAIVLAGQSHTGKSTFAGWLTAHGWGFLTDEVALLERRHGRRAGRPSVLATHRRSPWRPA